MSGDRFSDNNFIKTTLELLLLASLLIFVYLVWKRTTSSAATQIEKIIQLLRILLVAVLFFSVGLLPSDKLRGDKGLLLGLMICCLVSVLGIIISTILLTALTSKKSLNDSKKDSSL